METPSGATTETTTTTPSGVGAANPGAESPPAAKGPGENERIDELTLNWRESQRNTEHYRNRTTELERELAAERAKGKAAPATSDDSETDDDVKTLADFKYDDKAYGIYVRDLARKEANRAADAIRRENSEGQTKAAKDAATVDFQERAESWAKEQKLENPELMFASPANGGPTISDAMAETIMSSDHGPELLNYLTRNKAEARRIVKLSPILQAREIGRLEAKFATPTPGKTVSGAPPPHETVKGASATSTAKAPAEMTDTEWWADKKRREAAGKRKA